MIIFPKIPSMIEGYVFLSQTTEANLDFWKCISNDSEYFIKLIPKESLVQINAEIKLGTIVNFYKRLDFFPIEPLLEIIKNDEYFGLVFKNTSNLTLKQYIKQNGPINNVQKIRRLLNQIIKILKYIESLEAPENYIINYESLFVDESLNITNAYILYCPKFNDENNLSDISIEIQNLSIGKDIGIANFLPPLGNSLLNQKHISSWIAGVFAHFIYLGKLPFNGKSFHKIRSHIRKKHPRIYSLTNTEKDLESFLLEELIRNLLVKNSETRPNISNIKSFAFFSRNSNNKKLKSNTKNQLLTDNNLIQNESLQAIPIQKNLNLSIKSNSMSRLSLGEKKVSNSQLNFRVRIIPRKSFLSLNSKKATYNNK